VTTTEHTENIGSVSNLLGTVSNDVPFDDHNKLEALLLRARVTIEKLFGEDSQYLLELNMIIFTKGIYREGGRRDLAAESEAWDAGRIRFQNLCQQMIEDLNASFLQEARNSALSGTPAPAPNKPSSNKVFIVHGHDSDMKSQIARALETFGFEAVILHEQPDQRTMLIEKFEDRSDVGFAVVLLSGDDLAYPRIGKPEDVRPRARQNVILELGFFLGKLGRNRVLALYRKVHNFELPSDYQGVLYKEFDSAGAWKIELWKELKAAGYSVDANKLM
jgi:predicted nucleotide-binding protein